VNLKNHCKPDRKLHIKTMNKVFALITLFALTFCLNLHAQLPTNSPVLYPPAGVPVILTITNGSNVETVSNGVVIATTPIAAPAPSPTEIADIAASLGIPSWIVSLIPLKYILWLGVLIWILPYAGRAWHAWQADGGAKGVAAAVAFGTNVPVALKVQATGQPVVPTVPVNAGTPPKV
jgi:hypothetical protein